MLTLKKLMGRRSPEERSETVGDPDDRAIIHDSVPEAVLVRESAQARPTDNSWFDAVPIQETSGTVARAPAAPASEPRKEARPAVKPAAAATGRGASPAAAFAGPANAETAARPRNPYGWLVVVEGPGVGEWFVLERGVSHIGSAEGQTVRLAFGDETVAPVRHAALAYDGDRHVFVLEGNPDAALRLNGRIASSRTDLRDGDVIGVGGTSLRLVALCTPNFHWGSEPGAH